jgi:ABC-type thiamine transport system substrate-binding protein|tara:strand:- start:1111 stop:1278 length:168 start_codon:yes stop_codon:yes gene_type:complete
MTLWTRYLSEIAVDVVIGLDNHLLGRATKKEELFEIRDFCAIFSEKSMGYEKNMI